MLSADFATVQWARKMAAAIEPLSGLSPDELRKLGHFLQSLADFRAAGGELSAPQLQVILQNLHVKQLRRLEPDKGGVLVEFSGGGFAFERFLIRDDGRVPNFRYEATKE